LELYERVNHYFFFVIFFRIILWFKIKKFKETQIEAIA
jgi:hypothetical protein